MKTKNRKATQEAIVKRQSAIERAVPMILQKGGTHFFPEGWKKDQKFRVTCSLGHEWQTTAYKILEGDWCPRCSVEARAFSTRQATYAKLVEFLTTTGGRVLSPSYDSRKQVLDFECASGHRWQGVPTDVLARQVTCPGCRQDRERARVQHQKDAHKLRVETSARERTARVFTAAVTAGYRLLEVAGTTDEYRYQVECPRHGLGPRIQWRTAQRGYWCVACNAEDRSAVKREATLQKAQKVAADHGGRVLEDRVAEKASHLVFQCAKGHEWSAPVVGVVGPTKAWCTHPECRKKIAPESVKTRQTKAVATRLGKLLKVAGTIAQNHGGVCLSSEYRSSEEGLRFRCARGHEFSMPFKKLRRNWCPLCSNRHSMGENLTRLVLEQLTGLEFPPSRPRWLQSEEGRRLSLDGYNAVNQLAFEYQGYGVHKGFRATGRYSDPKKFQRTLELDARKVKVCQEQGVTLLVIEGDEHTTSIARLTQKVRAALESRHVPFNSAAQVVIDPSALYKDDLPQRVQEFCSENGGKLVSPTVLGMLYRVEVECGHCGRRWEPTVAKLLHARRWCRCRTRSLDKSGSATLNLNHDGSLLPFDTPPPPLA